MDPIATIRFEIYVRSLLQFDLHSGSDEHDLTRNAALDNVALWKDPEYPASISIYDFFGNGGDSMSTESGDPPSGLTPKQSICQEIFHFIRDRGKTTARIAVLLFFDTLLFMIWVLLAWIGHLTAVFAHEHGVNEYFANGFLWVSSASTFALTTLHIGADIVNAFRELRRQIVRRSPENDFDRPPLAPTLEQLLQEPSP